MLVDSPINVGNARPIINDDWRDEFLLVDEGSSLQPSLEGMGNVGGESVADDDCAMIRVHMTVTKVRDWGRGVLT